MKNIRSRIPESTHRFISHSDNYDAQSCTHAAATTRRPGLNSHCAPALPASSSPNTRARSINLGRRARCCCAHLRISCRASLRQPPAPAPAPSALVRGCHRRKLLHVQTLRIRFRAALPTRIQQRRKSCRRIQAGSAQHTAANCAGAPRTPAHPARTHYNCRMNASERAHSQ